MSIFRTEIFPNIEDWSASLADFVEDHINLLYFNSLYYLLDKKGIKVKKQNIFKLPIWSLYECENCGTRTVGIPKIEDGRHYNDSGEVCGKMILKLQDLDWKEARGKSDDGLIFGAGIPAMFLPDCIDTGTYNQIVFDALQNVDDLVDKIDRGTYL
jgi:hypothetical protein